MKSAKQMFLVIKQRWKLAWLVGRGTPWSPWDAWPRRPFCACTKWSPRLGALIRSLYKGLSTVAAAAENKSCPLRLYWVLTTSSAMLLRLVSLPSLLRSYWASTERYWLLPARTTSTRSSRCDYATRYRFMRVQWRSSDVCSRHTVRSPCFCLLGPCWWAVMW